MWYWFYWVWIYAEDLRTSLSDFGCFVLVCLHTPDFRNEIENLIRYRWYIYILRMNLLIFLDDSLSKNLIDIWKQYDLRSRFGYAKYNIWLPCLLFMLLSLFLNASLCKKSLHNISQLCDLIMELFLKKLCKFTSSWCFHWDIYSFYEVQ